MNNIELRAAADATHTWVTGAAVCVCTRCLAGKDDPPSLCPRVVADLSDPFTRGLAVTTLMLCTLRAWFSGDPEYPRVVDAVRAAFLDAGLTISWDEGHPARRAKKASLSSPIAQADLTYRGAAVFSDDGAYRYLLARCWKPGAPVMVFVMCNPSDAGAHKEDNTIRRCLGFAKREGCGGFVVVNGRAYIATNPKDLAKTADSVGPFNNAFVEAAVRFACEGDLRGHPFQFVAAWGSVVREMTLTAGHFMYVTRKLGLEVLCLGVTKDGAPRHPLRLANDTPLSPYTEARSVARATRLCVITEWIVSVAVPAALRQRGCEDAAEVLATLGPGPFAVATARVVLAKDVDNVKMAAERKRAALIVIAATELYDLALKVAFQDPLVKRAEALAREAGALAGMTWSGGGAA